MPFDVATAKARTKIRLAIEQGATNRSVEIVIHKTGTISAGCGDNGEVKKTGKKDIPMTLPRVTYKEPEQ